jgi:hypothetical protein
MEVHVTWIGPASEEETEVPDVVGLTVTAAYQVATDRGLKLAAADPDGPPLSALTGHGVWLITDQQPAAGSRMRRKGSMVVVCEQAPDDLAGDREPRRPLPRLDGLNAELDPTAGDDPTR